MNKLIELNDEERTLLFKEVEYLLGEEKKEFAFLLKAIEETTDGQENKIKREFMGKSKNYIILLEGLMEKLRA